MGLNFDFFEARSASLRQARQPLRLFIVIFGLPAPPSLPLAQLASLHVPPCLLHFCFWCCWFSGLENFFFPSFLLFILFFYYVLLFSLYFCLLLNPNLLGFRLFVCVGNLSFVVLILNLLGLLENWYRSKFLGILLLLMVLLIIVYRDFHWLHSQVISTFLASFRYLEVLVVWLDWFFQLLNLYLFSISCICWYHL
jgi:hypothetical protein